MRATTITTAIATMATVDAATIMAGIISSSRDERSGSRPRGRTRPPDAIRGYVSRPHFVRGTALGFAFIRACTEPTGAQTGAQEG
jgi:hypothetical protein